MAHGLDLVGERWALLVVRELMLGAKRFGDIKDGLPGISSQRALAPSRRARAGRAWSRGASSPNRPPSGSTTSPTGRRELEPMMQQFGRWAARTLTTARICTSA